jgi:hypothetical protein
LVLSGLNFSCFWLIVCAWKRVPLIDLYLGLLLSPVMGLDQSMSPVGPRASKEEFMQALGMNSQDPQHEQIYRAMRVCPVVRSL